jgi:polysaccharide biosynthesis/export protein
VETVPPVVYVMGEVNAAGPIPLTGRLDMMQALAMARGFKDFANTKKITVRRGTQTLKFNYNDALKGNASPLYLQPGDIIIVP